MTSPSSEDGDVKVDARSYIKLSPMRLGLVVNDGIDHNECTDSNREPLLLDRLEQEMKSKHDHDCIRTAQQLQQPHVVKYRLQ
ncbi:hypothetical protein ACOSQ2_005407 [Xanthoceras sorbifolium]